ncbi:hypothetical protein P692DRAFT_20723435, partial [Suillus brevipes Sb2]
DMALPLKLMRKQLQPYNAQMEMSSTIQNNQVSPQQGHKHLKYNQSKHKYKSQQADRKTLCTKVEDVWHAHALFPHSCLTPLIINIRHRDCLPPTRIHCLLSPKAPPPLINTPLGIRHRFLVAHIGFSVGSSICAGDVTLVGIGSLAYCVVMARYIQLAGVNRILERREFL